MIRPVASYTFERNPFGAAEIDSVMQGLSEEIHAANVEKGFWPVEKLTPFGYATAIGLLHAEVSELLEEAREASPHASSKVPGVTAEEEELADVIIRALDYAAARGFSWSLGSTIRKKLLYNLSRPYRHGSKLF